MGRRTVAPRSPLPLTADFYSLSLGLLEIPVRIQRIADLSLPFPRLDGRPDRAPNGKEKGTIIFISAEIARGVIVIIFLLVIRAPRQPMVFPVSPVVPPVERDVNIFIHIDLFIHAGTDIQHQNDVRRRGNLLARLRDSFGRAGVSLQGQGIVSRAVLIHAVVPGGFARNHILRQILRFTVRAADFARSRSLRRSGVFRLYGFPGGPAGVLCVCGRNRRGEHRKHQDKSERFPPSSEHARHQNHASSK